MRKSRKTMTPQLVAEWSSGCARVIPVVGANGESAVALNVKVSDVLRRAQEKAPYSDHILCVAAFKARRVPNF